jgi:ABC-type proline/glycine betaine transport system substrate-binding protein
MNLLKKIMLAASMMLALNVANAASAPAPAPAYTFDLSGLSLFVVDANTDVTVTYLSKDASYTHDLSLSSLGTTIIDTGTDSTSTTVNLGSFAVGTEMIFKLFVNNTQLSFFSGAASNNIDGVVHTGMDQTTVADRVVMGFEDLLLENTDNDYNDLVFSVSNVNAVSAVPEPATLALMLGGLGLVGFMASRRKTA